MASRNKCKYSISKRAISVALSLIMAFGTFASMTAGGLFLSDFVDFKAFAAEDEAEVAFYRYGELVGINKTDYANSEKIEYRLGDSGEWTEYSAPFAISAYETTKVYARAGEGGDVIYENISSLGSTLGVYSEAGTDFDFSYKNIVFEYTRTYSSLENEWFTSFDSTAKLKSSRLEVRLPDGSECILVQTGESTFRDELRGFTAEIRDNHYIVDVNSYKYFYKIKNNKLDAVEDRFGTRLEITEKGDLTGFVISDNQGRSFFISHMMGRIDEETDEATTSNEITDPNGNKLTYSYENKFDADTVKMYNNCICVTDGAGVIIGQYEYDNTEAHRLVRSMDKAISYNADGRLAQVKYDDGSFIKYTYDDENMLYTTLSSSGAVTKTVYNDAFLPVSYTDESGSSVSYTYDDNYNASSVTAGNTVTAYTYDENGNILTWKTTDESGEVNSGCYTYDDNQNIIKEQNGDAYTYYAYDENGNLSISATLKEDYEGEAPPAYDSSLSCFNVTEYTYNEDGSIKSEKDILGNTTSYEYDAFGNVVKEIFVCDDSEPLITEYTYDALGNVLTSTCGDDSSSYVYDGAGRVLLSNDYGECTRTLYDEYGRVVQEISPEDYDASLDGLPNKNTYADADAGHRYFYNESNQLVKEINRLDVTTVYDYYETGETKSESFDIYKYCYNTMGSLTETYVGGSKTISYEYDDRNNLILQSYANGQSIRYAYDENDNVTAQYHDSDTEPYVTYTYSEDGELTEKINTDADLKYIYGENGHVSIYTLSNNALIQSYEEVETQTNLETGEFGYKAIDETHFGYDYSSVVRPDSVTYSSNNNTVEYLCETDNDFNSVSESIVFNSEEQLTTSYEMDDNGNCTCKTIDFYPYEIDFSNTYDDENRIIKDYSKATEYVYDEYGQIRRSIENEYGNVYSYDKRGNIITHVLKRDLSLSVMLHKNKSNPDLVTLFNGVEITYDEIGNPISYGGTTFNWSSGRYLESVSNGSDYYSYTYDENGIRTSKTVNGVTTQINTVEGRVVAQTDGENTLYFQYNAMGMPLGFIYNGEQYFYMTNQMGDVIGILDETGELVVFYQYDDWGKSLGILGDEELAKINPLRYRGYYYDEETGFYYLQSRYYNPEWFRFINADEYEYIDKESYAGTNLYAYCNNDPINKFDPDGHFIKLLIQLIQSIRISICLAPFNNKYYFKAEGKTAGTGILHINIEKGYFYDAIYTACRTNKDAAYGTLAVYAEKFFFNEMNRNIYFTTECLKKEIQLHVEAFLWYKKYKNYSGVGNMNCPTVIRLGAMVLKTEKTIDAFIYDSTKSIEIKEEEAKDLQALAFDYYHNIRSDYSGNKSPYYLSDKKKIMSYNDFLRICMNKIVNKFGKKVEKEINKIIVEGRK